MINVFQSIMIYISIIELMLLQSKYISVIVSESLNVPSDQIKYVKKTGKFFIFIFFSDIDQNGRV